MTLTRFNSAVLVLATAIILSACGANDVPTSVSNVSTAISDGSTIIDTVPDINQLSAQLPTIQQSLDAGKTDEAKSAFNTLIMAWDGVKDQAKVAAPDLSDEIQVSMDSIKATLIDTELPDATSVKATLTTLETQLQALASSL